MQIGVVLPLAEYPWKQPTYSEIRDLALQAEASGFDSVWVFDHLLFRAPGEPSEGIWESWTVVSALAEATASVQLGTFVLCTAFRNPAVLAKMAVTLDEVSGGRLVLGLGAGWHKPEFDAYGIPFADRVGRFEESLHIITAMLRGARLDYRGNYYRLQDCELRPPPTRTIPVLVGGTQPRMLRLTARHADLWNICWFGPPDGLEDVLMGIRGACVAEGRDPRSLGITMGVNVVPVAPDTPEPPLPGYPVLRGTPTEVAGGLRDYAALGVEHLVCNLNPHHSAVQRLLAEAVALYRAEATHANRFESQPEGAS